jgi:hypothetical protein
MSTMAGSTREAIDAASRPLGTPAVEEDEACGEAVTGFELEMPFRPRMAKAMALPTPPMRTMVAASAASTASQTR